MKHLLVVAAAHKLMVVVAGVAVFGAASVLSVGSHIPSYVPLIGTGPTATASFTPTNKSFPTPEPRPVPQLAPTPDLDCTPSRPCGTIVEPRRVPQSAPTPDPGCDAPPIWVDGEAGVEFPLIPACDPSLVWLTCPVATPGNALGVGSWIPCDSKGSLSSLPSSV